MPRRTLAEYVAAGRHAVGGALSNDTADARLIEIVNDALRDLAQRAPWPWLLAGPTLLSLTADQNYVLLPAGLRTIETLTHTQLSVASMRATTLDAIERMRSWPVVSDVSLGGFYWAVNMGATAGSPAALSPRLEIYPTPAATAADALSLTYWREVTRLANLTDVPQIPETFDTLLYHGVRALALLEEDDDHNSGAMRHYERLVEREMQNFQPGQLDLGPIMGGAALGGPGVETENLPAIVPDRV